MSMQDARMTYAMATFTPEELLKFRLLADGIRVHESARTAWRERFDGPLTLAEYATTSGVSLVIAGDLYVNAPLATAIANDAPLLRFVDDTFVIDDGTLTTVGVIPVPAFHTATLTDTTTGIAQPVTNYGVTHTDRVRIVADRRLRVELPVLRSALRVRVPQEA